MTNKNEFRNNLKERKRKKALENSFINAMNAVMNLHQTIKRIAITPHNFKNGGISSNEIKPIYLDNKEIVFQETLIDNEEPKYEQTFLVKDGKLTPIKNDSHDK